MQGLSLIQLFLKRRYVIGTVCLVFMMSVVATALYPFLRQPEMAHASIDDLSTPPSIGINLNNVGDSSSDYLFADAFKAWRLQPPPGQSNIPGVDSNGWPQGDGSALLWDGAFLSHTNGSYALRFHGKASLSLSLVSGSITNQSYDAASNTTTATITLNNGTAVLNFTNTQRTGSGPTNTGITDIQLMRPVAPGSSTSYSFSTLFTDQVKNLISKFQVIRFMDYSATNSNGQVNWSDRRLPQENQQGGPHNANSYGWQGLGAAWEYAIQLCNETNRDAYINIPELATGTNPNDTSSYIYKLAQLFKYGSDAQGTVYTSLQANPVHAPLNPNLHLYVEYSNEVWNTGGAFQQTFQNYNAAKAEVAAGNSPLNYDGASDWVWAWRRQAKRLKETSEIFRAVFGDSAMMTRVRPLLEWQVSNGQGTGQTELSFLDDYYNNGAGQFVTSPHPVSYYVWGGGGAAYSGVNDDRGSTVDAIYNTGLATTSFMDGVTSDSHLLRAFGLHQVAYEGGFTIGGDVANAVARQANVDPRAKMAEQTFQTLFSQAGGELLMYFNSSGDSAYGMADPDVYSQNTPKLQAVDSINQNPQAKPTIGTAIPGIISGNNWSVNSRGWGTPTDGPLNNFGTVTDQYGTSPVSSASYTLKIAQAGTYQVAVNYSSHTNSGLKIYVGSTLLATLSIPNTNEVVQSTPAFPVSLPVGLSAIRLVATSGANNYTINSLQIQSGSGSTTPIPTVTPTSVSTPTSTPTPNENLPSPWQTQDIGSVGQTGSASYNNGTFTVAGSGSDIWDTTDAFRYAYQSLSGDGMILARVASEQNTDSWAKAGVMIRSSLSAGSTHVLMALTPGNGPAFQRRISPNGISVTNSGTSVTAPYWVKLQRSGNTFTGSISSNGSTWTQVGSETISMGSGAYIGLAVTAHNNSVLNTSTFTNVSVTIGGGTSGGTLFSTGFESGNPQPTWNDSVDTSGWPAGGSQNVVGICCGASGPEASPRNETTHSGSTALMYSGLDNSSSTSYAYLKVFDLSGQNVTVGSQTTLDYWIYPQSSSLTNGGNSTCVAIDLIFSDTSNLRDSGAVDQNGVRTHPEYQCSHLTLNTWNHVVVNLGLLAAGKTIVRIDLGYDQSANTGGFRGYLDDLSLYN